MIDSEYIVTAAQQAADAGQPPHAVLRLVMEQVRAVRPEIISLVTIEGCLIEAFHIPLYDTRDIVERWTGVTPYGDWGDANIDQQFGPWIARYREQCQQAR